MWPTGFWNGACGRPLSPEETSASAAPGRLLLLSAGIEWTPLCWLFRRHCAALPANHPARPDAGSLEPKRGRQVHQFTTRLRYGKPSVDENNQASLCHRCSFGRSHGRPSSLTQSTGHVSYPTIPDPLSSTLPDGGGSRDRGSGQGVRCVPAESVTRQDVEASCFSRGMADVHIQHAPGRTRSVTGES